MKPDVAVQSLRNCRLATLNGKLSFSFPVLQGGTGYNGGYDFNNSKIIFSTNILSQKTQNFTKQ